MSPAETSSLASVSGEFIYRLMNVYFDPIGLRQGRYPFMGEFHSETAQGVVIAE